MISCYLMHSKQCPTPFEAMSEFEKKRTKDQRGVTIPSQRRYVEYYGLYLKNNLVYKDLDIRINSIKLSQETSFDFKCKLLVGLITGNNFIRVKFNY
jgi:phosphatidylinositol-3,4,5-trisphosphate 3-phosphatase/dual-specificity protein phosphatase PTEN